jgi:hypothetical protein
MAKRRTMSAAGARMLGGRSDGREGTESRGGSGPFIKVESGGRHVHARCPIRAGAKPEARTPRSRLYNVVLNVFCLKVKLPYSLRNL